MKTSTVMTGVLVSLAFASVASAGDDKAKPAPQKKVPDGPQAMKKAPPPEPPAMPEKPTPPPELLAFGKSMKGTWSCKAEMFDPMQQTSYKTTITMKVALDLGSMWIKTDMTEAKSKGTKYPFAFHAYTTYDAMAKSWKQVMIDNWGITSTGTSAGPDADGKVVFEMDMDMMGTPVKFRDNHEPGAKKGTVHMWGEMQMPGGTGWVKAYDAVCKKKK